MQAEKNRRWMGFIVAITMGMAGLLSAVELAGPCGDHAVLQRDEPVVIWGQAAAGETVAVTLAEKSGQAVADGAGNWEVTLPAMAAGGPYTLEVKGGGQTVSRADIYLGDVWVFSGQSNLQVSFDYFRDLKNIDPKYYAQFKQDVERCAEDKLVRNYMAATRDAKGETVRNAAENKWIVSHPEEVKECNPIAYYFAREVARKTGVMTASVRLAWGGQYIERFYAGAGIYEYMLKPWGRYPIKGVIWYQGENNLHKDGDRLGYALKLQLLINDFRALWNKPELPFFIVQLPPAVYSERPFNDQNSLPIFLEAQRQPLAIPHTAMAVTSDLGMANGVHQPQKYEVAVRLANLAFARVYGFADAIPAGPQYKSHRIEGNKIRVEFETFGSQLTTRDGNAPRFFEVLEEGKTPEFFGEAQARIEGNSVVVWSEQVAKPKDVRFAFWEKELMNTNLTNAQGIPAATFWAGATRQMHPDLH